MKVHVGRYPSQRLLRKNPEAEQKISVRVDPWDTWNLDATLAHIIAPCLRQLKETKHGAPYVRNEDVPAHLHGPEPDEVGYPSSENDPHYFERWDWVLDEMIWAFETYQTDWESQFHSGKIDFVWKPVGKDGTPWEGDEKKAPLYEMAHGSNHTAEFDKEGYELFLKRLQNGFRLFGTYYMNLWD